MPKTLGKQLDQFGAGKAGAVPGPSAEDGSEILFSDGWQQLEALLGLTTYVLLRSTGAGSPKVVPTNSNAIVNNYDEIVDPDGLYDPVTGQCSLGDKPGLYIHAGASTLAELNDQAKLIVRVFKNENPWALIGRGGSSTDNASGDFVGFGGCTAYFALPGDVFDLRVFHNAGSDKNLVGSLAGLQQQILIRVPNLASLAAVTNTSRSILNVEPEGLTLSRNSGNAQYLDIAAGSWLVWDGSQIQRVELAMPWTKHLDTVFSEGDAGGLLPAATSIAADTGYYVFCGRKKATGAIDFQVDTVLAGTNLDSGFNWRVMGWQRTNGSSEIIPLIQIGDYFTWATTPTILNAWVSTAPNGSTYPVDFAPPEGLCEVCLTCTPGHHNNDASRRHVIYLGTSETDLSSFTSGIPGSAINPFATSSVEAASVPNIDSQTQMIAISDGLMRMKMVEDNPNRSTPPTVTLPGFRFVQRRVG